MTMRMRKLTGTVLLLVLIVVYSLCAMAVAMVLQMQSSNKIIELIYYVIAGTLWVIPAAIIIKWMQKWQEPTA
jgi:predicted membrane channel-forming protein YqfA (hemolysin III family)